MAESDNYSNLDNNNIGNVTEFNNDVYVYGTLYADLFGNTSIEQGVNLDVNNLLLAMQVISQLYEAAGFTHVCTFAQSHALWHTH